MGGGREFASNSDGLNGAEIAHAVGTTWIWKTLSDTMEFPTKKTVITVPAA